LTANGEKYDKIFLTSDDFEWCKQNIHIPADVIYLEDETPFDTIMLGSLCKDFIATSSTFSWWCAWLGEKNGGRIICPNKKFVRGYVEENKVFYPERWTKVEDMEGLYEK
jgi:hypothetical protein